jgi:cytochrome c oxidase assembly protein subunit 15
VIVAAVVLVTARHVAELEEQGPVGSLARKLELLVWLQLVAGGVNVALAAPWWMQLLHLLLAQGLWIVLVLFFFAGSERGQQGRQGAISHS